MAHIHEAAVTEMSRLPERDVAIDPADSRSRVPSRELADIREHGRSRRITPPQVAGLEDDRFFVAERRPDGMYAVTFSAEGIATFETALGIAHDLGRNSRISPFSTIADIMDRTATRDELSAALRADPPDVRSRLRITLLKRKYRGSERPNYRQIVVGHIGKVLIVLLFVVWTLQQFITAVQDIAAIPGLLLNAPVDILHPTEAFSQVGANISDAARHFVFGIVGLHIVYIVIALIRPFARIYRKDQILPGERPLLWMLDRALTPRTERRPSLHSWRSRPWAR